MPELKTISLMGQKERGKGRGDNKKIPAFQNID